MNLFKKLYEGAESVINEMRLPFIEKSVKRSIESAKDNALQKINDIEIERFNLLKNGISDGTIKSDAIAGILEKEIDKEDQNRIIAACDRLMEDLFGEPK